VISPGSGRDQLGSRRDQCRIEVILPRSAEDRCDLAGIRSESAGVTPGSAEDRRDQMKITVILPELGRDQLGSRRDQSKIEVILPGLADDRHATSPEVHPPVSSVRIIIMARVLQRFFYSVERSNLVT